MHHSVTLSLAILLWAAPSAGSDFSAVEHYGKLPYIRSVSVSPNGKLITYIQRGEEGDYFVIADRRTREVIGGGDARKIKARSIDFATDRHVILFVSETDRWGARFRWEQTGSFVYDLESGNLRRLLDEGRDVSHFQSGVGRIVGIDRDDALVYMPAFAGSQSPRLNLFEVSLSTTAVRTHAYGSTHTIDWFVDRSGRVVAREDFHAEDNKHQVFTPADNGWKLIFEDDSGIPEMTIGAVSDDGRHLYLSKEANGRDRVFRLSLENGSLDGPLYDEAGRGTDALLTRGHSRNFAGVRYNGLRPGFWYTDPAMQAHLVAMEATFPNSAVERLSATDDLSTIVFRVSGNDAAQDFVLFDTQTRSLEKLESSYPHIPSDQIGSVEAIRYTARDGTPIPAIVTWPPGIAERKRLPMIVFPHGGPESYDNIGFDWWAQYFVRNGYVVLQPNFRGSAGFGAAFRDAGRGGWGKGVMQHDLTDGVHTMIDAGYVDPDRICIMGASYGGYAALAGGAFTPELYRCVISVNGVSDLHQMMRKTKFRFGSDSWVVRYWRESMDDSAESAQRLKDISPARFAEAFRAPVLLLHGKDDTVVPWQQSLYMSKALSAADKDVEFVTIKGEDHWLSSSATRIAILRAIANFVRKHNPPG